MKWDFLKAVDVLLIVCAGTVWAQPAGKLAGTPQEKAAARAKLAKYQSDKARCEAEAKKPQQVAHPNEVVPYPVAYDRCMRRR